jgi:uncharacterized protein involved in tellurium resistance
MNKRELQKLEEILLYHLMHLNLPIEKWQVVDGFVIVQWTESKQIKEARYEF